MKAHRERGVTLLDMTIATAVLALVVGMAYPGFKVANDTITTSTKRARADRAGGRVLRTLLREIRSGDVLNVNSGPKAPSVTIRRIEGDMSLAKFQASSDLPWGAANVVLEFRRRRVVQESALGEDLNGDGDRKDSFAIGRIYITEDGLSRPLSEAASVILGLPGHTADVDGDGAEDPLFRQNGESLEVIMHLLERTPGGTPMVLRRTGEVHIRNVKR